MPTAAADSTVQVHIAPGFLTAPDTGSTGVQLADTNRLIDPSREAAMTQLSSMEQIIEYLRVLYR